MTRRLAALLFAGVLLAGSRSATADIAWRTEPFDQLLETARTQNKTIFIDFYAVWCGPCKRMHEKTYPEARVQALLNSMLPAEYDAEKEPWIALAKEYRIANYPTFVVIGPDGREIDRHIGFLEPDEFLEQIGSMAKGISGIDRLETWLEDHPDDFDSLIELGTKHAEAAHPDEATAAFTRAMKLDPKNEKGRYPEMLYALGVANYNAGRPAEAKTHLERLVTDYPESDDYRDGMARLAAAEFKLGNADKAVGTYWSITEKRQDDSSALNAFAWFCSQRKIGLDKALPAALKAVEISDRDPGILDTLAEVYFAKGDYDNAIKVESEAAAKKPGDTYYTDQIEKYKKAKDEADQARR